MSIRMRPAPTAGVNGRNAGGGGPVAGGGRDGPGTPGESRMQQYMRRVLEAGQRGDRLETSPPAPSDPSPAPNPAVKRKASVRVDGTDEDDDDRGSVDERTEPSIASVVDAFAATVMTGGTLMVHEWEYAASGARAGQKRVGIYSGQNQYETPHQNAQFLMKLALRAALGAQMDGNDWSSVTRALVEWREHVMRSECKYVATDPSNGETEGLLSDFLAKYHPEVLGGLNRAFQDLDTNNGLDWAKLDRLIDALCVLMQTSVVVADHLVGNSVPEWKNFELVNGAHCFEATDAWRGSRDGYGNFAREPPNVRPFESGTRWEEYRKLRDMNMRNELAMDFTPYVWLGLFLQFRISAPDTDRGVLNKVRALLVSIGKHFLKSYASSEYAPGYQMPPENGFTYDSSVTADFRRMPTVKHGFEHPIYDQEAWDRAKAQNSQTEWGEMSDELEAYDDALSRSLVDDYNHRDANVFDPVEHLTIVYEVSAEDPNESDNESDNDSDATDED